MNQQIFNETADYYNNILEKNGYREKIEYIENNTNTKRAKREREIIWYNPPFSKNVKTKIGYHFINLIDKHFGNKDNVLNKIFNRNKIKIGYSCMNNIGKIIKAHNAKLLNKTHNQQPACNCRNKQQCPLNGKCRCKNIVYLAQVKTQNPNENHNQNDQIQTDTNQLNDMRYPSRERGNETMNGNNDNNEIDGNTDNIGTLQPTHTKEMFYIGAAEDFKTRFANHQKSFRHEKYKAETELSKYIWNLKSKNLNYSVHWRMIKQTSGYNKISKLCSLCTSEKLEILKFKYKKSLLNKRNELVNKCRHENKHLLNNLPDP